MFFRQQARADCHSHRQHRGHRHGDGSHQKYQGELQRVDEGIVTEERDGLLALMNAGYFEEACAWRGWLLRAAAGSPDQLQVMYGIRGERHLMEWEVGWLCGYENSKPVRIGNAAYTQLQLDVYGEIADALLRAHLGGIPPSNTDSALLATLTDHLMTIWEQPDEGIWEMRGGRKQFTYSKIMAWVAFDRAIQSAEKFGLRGDVERWRQVRDKIHRDICQKAYNRSLGSFTQTYGSKDLDASTAANSAGRLFAVHGPASSRHNRSYRKTFDASRSCSPL